MAIVTKEVLKSYFAPARVPVNSNYVDFIDTMGSFPPQPHVHSASDIDGGQPVFTTLGSLGDLTIGPGSGVLFVDVSGQNVGINCTPDPQFDLDVAGAVRAGVFYGPIGRVLKDPNIICHFDGEQPFVSNYTGDATGHLGQVATIYGGVMYRPGKFGKGVQFGSYTQNLIPNPDAEYGDGFWTKSSSLESFSRGNTQKDIYGNYIFVLQETVGATGSGEYIYSDYINVTGGSTYSVSAYIRQVTWPSTQYGQLLVWWYDSSYTYLGNNGVYCNFYQGSDPYANDWVRFYASGPAPAAATYARVVINTHLSAGEVGTMYADAIQFELSNYPTPFACGDMPGHTWAGQKGGSITTRPSSGISFNLQDVWVETAIQTIMFWYYEDRIITGGYPAFFRMYYDSLNYFTIDRQHGASASCRPYIYGATGGTTYHTYYAGDTDQPVGWHHIAVVLHHANPIKFYIDGELTHQQSVIYYKPPYPTNVYIGANNDLTSQANTVMDDFVIVPYEITYDELNAIITSEAPVAAQSSTFSFRSGGGLVWADAEGLWIRDTSGLPVFGVSGVDGKSWGGRVLNAGDILIGEYGGTKGGYVFVDRDGVSGLPYLSIGYADKAVWKFDSGGASLTGVLDIDANGGIYQGSGSFSSPTTGLKIWNESGIGRIAGYNGGGNPQWFADTDGKLYAGDGAVILDLSGVSIEITGTGSVNANQLKFTGPLGKLGYLEGYTSGGAGNWFQIVAQNYNGINTNLVLSATGYVYINSDIVFDQHINGGQFKTQAWSLNDDTAVYIDPGLFTNGVLIISYRAGNNANGMFQWRLGSSPFMYSMFSTANVQTYNNSLLSGTTGTDGKLNVSSYSGGLLFIENRTGGVCSVAATLLGT